MSGKDASEAERAMRQYTDKPGFEITGLDLVGTERLAQADQACARP